MLAPLCLWASLDVGDPDLREAGRDAAAQTKMLCEHRQVLVDGAVGELLVGDQGVAESPSTILGRHVLLSRTLLAEAAPRKTLFIRSTMCS